MASFALEKAIVVGVTPIQQVNASFQKRELHVTIDNETQYPQTISIEVAQDKCNDPNLLEIRNGDEVTVHFNLRGNAWLDPKTNQNKIFNQLAYWKMTINRTSAGNNTQQNQANFVPQGTPTGYPPQQGYGQPQQGNPQQYQQPAPQQQGYQQGPPPQQQQYGNPNPSYSPPNQVPQQQQWVDPNQQQTQMQPQPNQQQQGYTTGQPPINDLPF